MSQADALRVPLPDERMAGALTILRELATLLNGEYGAPANLVGYDHVSTYPLLVQNQNGGASAPGINVLDNASAVIIQGTKAAVILGKAATSSSTHNVVGNFSVNTNKFTVTASNGNTAVLGDFAVNTNKFTVAASTGNTVVAGTLQVDGNITHDTTLLTTDITNNKVAIGSAAASTGPMLDVAGSMRATSATNPSAGTGAEMHYDAVGSIGRVLAIDRGTTTWKDMAVKGLSVQLVDSANATKFQIDSTGVGFFATTPAAQQTVTGTRTGTLAQLQTVVANLLAALDTYGLIVDSTT